MLSNHPSIGKVFRMLLDIENPKYEDIANFAIPLFELLGAKLGIPDEELTNFAEFLLNGVLEVPQRPNQERMRDVESQLNSMSNKLASGEKT